MQTATAEAARGPAAGDGKAAPEAALATAAAEVGAIADGAVGSDRLDMQSFHWELQEGLRL